jgi:50S ribosomal subunit-associated GTPase HflX
MLADKPELIVANKMDLTDSDQALIKLRQELDAEVIGISAVAGTGLKQLMEKLWDMLADLPHEDTGDCT